MPTPLLPDEVRVPQAVVRALRTGGVDHVYGMPGGSTVQLFDALYDHRDAIRTVLVREEAHAGVMAEVHGRLTGRPAVAMGQGAFMVQASLGAIEALLSSSPMLLLADLSDGGAYAQHGPYQSGAGTYGAWDARSVFAGITKRVFVATTPIEAVQCVQLGLKHALTGEPGPVAVLFGAASLRGRIGPDVRPSLWSTADLLPGTELLPGTDQRPVDAASVDAAARLLAGAERPVIVAGGGVRVAGAPDDLARLARAVAAPVATTAGGKGVFAETDDLALGVFGNFGTPLANAVVGAADVVLAVGTKLGPSDTALGHPDLLDPGRQTLVHVDIEPANLSWTFPADLAIAGDARAVLARIGEAATPLVTSEVRARRLDAVAEAVAAHGRFDAPELASDAVPVLPQRVIAELHRAIPDDAIVCCDAGENRIFMTHYFRTRSAPGFVQPAGVGAMGYAIPAALGAELAHGRPAVAVCGDGGFAIAMNALMTAREEDLAPTVVVMNNSALGWVLHGQRNRPIASDLGTFDHAAIARAMGCDGIRVERPDELAPALAAALASRRPSVVDVVTSLDETFEKVTSPLMAR